MVVDDPIETAERLALAKAQSVAERHLECLVIGGDTVVALGSRQFAKPESPADGVAMLRALSGREHRVISAIALVWPGGEKVFFDVAKVTFRDLSDDEIEAYVATGEPMDKAGGYGIQGKAANFVARLEGDIETVIGLPIKKLELALSRLASA
jgi:septum formation protein